VRTIFLGSPPFATPVFERLAHSRHRPLALVTQPDRERGRGRAVEPSPLAARARELSIAVLQPANPHEPGVVAELAALRPDVLAVASYGVILKRELLELARRGALNVHASLLPRHRGASPIQAAILAGDEVTGVSIQRVVPALDEGDVLLAHSTPIGPEETAGELLERLAALGGDALVEALDLLESGRATFAPQDPARATYARKLTKERGAIDWSRSAAEIARLARAMRPWPLARCADATGRELSILRARAVAASPAAPVEPGTILEAGERFVVATGDGALAIDELVPAGKRAMSGAEFLRGARLAVGERLLPPPAK
jgi:methionyl-tRNA formyltransferase